MGKIKHKCFVHNCGSFYKIGDKNKHFFKFPKLEEQRERWIEALNVAPPFKTDNAFICEKHFSNNFFTNTQKTRLHKYALPSIFFREDNENSINKQLNKFKILRLLKIPM
jgi:hypothetical protein